MRFAVTGAWRADGENGMMSVEAESESAAAAIANARGLLVESVRLMAAPPPLPKPEPAKVQKKSPPPPEKPEYDFSIEVVGEAYYQSAIEWVVGGRTDRSCNQIHPAQLVLEDSNPFDDKAVAVFIKSKKCGHLSREDARKFRRHQKKRGAVQQVTPCMACVVGGWDRGDGDVGNFGIRLAL